MERVLISKGGQEHCCWGVKLQWKNQINSNDDLLDWSHVVTITFELETWAAFYLDSSTILLRKKQSIQG